MLQMKTSVSLGRDGHCSEIRKTLSQALLTVALILAAFLPQISAQQQTCVLACWDAQISLDQNCQAEVTTSMLADTSECPNGVFYVVVRTMDGVEIPTSPFVTEAELGMTLIAQVYDSGDPEQSCWSTITVQDYLPPVLECDCTPVTEITGTISQADPSFNRPFGDPPGCLLSGVGTDVYYDVFEFSITQAGLYTFEATGNFDGVGALYENTFDPGNPCTNLLEYDDDGGVGLNPMIELVLNMSPGDYILVTTTFSNGVTGTYTWDVSGAGFVMQDIDNCIKKCTDIDQNQPPPLAYDNCSENATVILLNQEVEPLCHPLFIKQLTRWWTAVDDHGNQSDTCMQVFFLERLEFGDINWPDSFTVNNGTQFQCDEPFADVDGDGFPDAVPTWLGGAGVPMVNGQAVYPDFIFYCNAQITYEDILIGPIGCVKKLMRIWTVYEWHCTGESTDIYIQLIEVVDTEGPDMQCPADQTVSTGTVDCEATVYLPIPDVVDNCNNVIQVSASYPFGFANNLLNTNGAYVQLPVGVNVITYIAYDACYNSTQCAWTITVQDLTAPVPICDEHTVVSLTNDYEHGLTLVQASAFDDGSYDECGPVTFSARRMDSCIDFDWTTYGAGIDEIPNGIINGYDQGYTLLSYVPFACCDVGSGPIMIELRVTDASGNYNSCMVEITVQDKLPPIIQCMNDITVSCDFDFDHEDLSIFGTIRTDPDDREEICVFDPANPNADGFGFVCIGLDGLAQDNCSVEITPASYSYLNSCGVGYILRTFVATDPGGRTASCNQYIYVENFDAFYITDQTCYNANPNDGVIWPCNMDVYGCGGNTDPEQTGAPQIFEDECDLVGVNYSDQVFEFVQGVCLKILRTWRVIDWCQYGPDGNGGYNGYWEYMQIIKVINTDAPEFLTDQEPISECNEIDCDDMYIELVQQAEDDCTPDAELRWTYSVDLYNDGSIQNQNSGFGPTIDASRFFPVGTHRIVYSFEDGCGSETVREQFVEIQSCVPPSPICLFLVAELDLNGTVIVWASDFDASSYHICGYPVTFSFSPDTTDKSRQYTCSNLGLNEVMIWVTDLVLGQQDFCTTSIDIQDNHQPPACDSPNLTGTISGTISTEFIQNVKDVSVALSGSGVFGVTTNGSGDFAFPSMPLGGSYDVMPEKNDDWKNGVSTLDLIQIQKHLLGIQSLSSPYKMIAADANKSNSISAIDIVTLRRLILGIINDVPENTSWRFVDESYDFTDPANPFNEQFAESYTIAPFASTMTDVDFIAIKIGDVNNTVVANLNDIVTRSNPDAMTLQVLDREVKAGEIVEVAIQAGESIALEGYQFTLNFDPAVLTLDTYAPGTIPVGDDNFNIRDAENGIITTSWSEVSPRALSPGSDLFGLKFTVLSDGVLSQMLSVSSDLTDAEAYNAEGEILDIELQFTDPQDVIPAVVEFELLENRPNPFTDVTTVSFISPRASRTTITIYDVTGVVVDEHVIDAQIGRNDVEIRNLQVRGVLYCQVSTDEFSATRKMIRIE